MLCIIFNEKKNKLKYQFGPCSKDLRKWANKEKEDGDEIKYILEENGKIANITGFKFLSLGRFGKKI